MLILLIGFVGRTARNPMVLYRVVLCGDPNPVVAAHTLKGFSMRIAGKLWFGRFGVTVSVYC